MKSFSFFLLLATQFVWCQISSDFYGKPKNFVDLKNRVLLVEVLEENKEILHDLRKPKQAEELAQYQMFLETLNADIKKYVEKYWKLNALIEFKTTSEINQLAKTSKQPYAVLRYLLLNEIGVIGLNTKSTVPAFAYTRIESSRLEPDAFVYLPFRSFNSDKAFFECDFFFALKLLQQNVEWDISNNKNYNFKKFAEKYVEMNCDKLKMKTLLVEEKMYPDEKDRKKLLKKYNGTVQFVTDSAINEAILTTAQNTAVLYLVPFGALKTGGIVKVPQIVYAKVIFDTQSHEIVWAYIPDQVKYGTDISNQLTDDDFKLISKCKMD